MRIKEKHLALPAQCPGLDSTTFIHRVQIPNEISVETQARKFIISLTSLCNDLVGQSEHIHNHEENSTSVNYLSLLNEKIT